jgi:hypothetical protein
MIEAAALMALIVKIGRLRHDRSNCQSMLYRRWQSP